MLRAAGVARDVRKRRALLRDRDVRVRRADRGPADAFAPVPGPDGGDAPVAAHRRAGLARLEPGPGHGRGPEGRAGRRSSRWGRTASATPRTYVRHIMEESMEALIHHFKIVTQGIEVPARRGLPAGRVPRGELGVYVVSDGGQPAVPRAHPRPAASPTSRRSRPMVVGGLIADVVAARRERRPGDGGRRPVTEAGVRARAPAPDVRGPDPRRDQPRAVRRPASWRRYPDARSALVPLLYLVQSEVGWVPPQGMREVAGDPRPHDGRGRGRRDLLHDGEAPPVRALRAVDLHEPVVRAGWAGSGCSSGRARSSAPRASTGSPTTACSRWKRRSAWPPATRRRWWPSITCTSTA